MQLIKDGRIKWGAAVLECKAAQIGVLITLEDPTAPMRTEAAWAGFYESPAQPGKLYSRRQILTVAELLDGKGIDMSAIRHEMTFKKAPRAKAKGTKSQWLPFEEPEAQAES